MKKNIFFTVLALILFYPVVSTAAPIKEFCKENAASVHRSFKSCIEAETKAATWLAGNPVPDDIYAVCRRGSGESRSLLKDCVLKETYIRNAQALSPLNLRNSSVWYAASLENHFPSLLRVCGNATSIDGFAVLPTDITKFNFSTKILYKEMLPLLNVKGRVQIAPVPLPMRVKKKKGGRFYSLYIDAFLISRYGRVIDISSTEATSQLSSKGGTVRFSFNIGKGYYFDKGGSVLVVASGSPITSAYPKASCLLLGAKKITFGK